MLPSLQAMVLASSDRKPRDPQSVFVTACGLNVSTFLAAGICGPVTTFPILLTNWMHSDGRAGFFFDFGALNLQAFDTASVGAHSPLLLERRLDTSPVFFCLFGEAVGHQPRISALHDLGHHHEPVLRAPAGNSRHGFRRPNQTLRVSWSFTKVLSHDTKWSSERRRCIFRPVLCVFAQQAIIARDFHVEANDFARWRSRHDLLSRK